MEQDDEKRGLTESGSSPLYYEVSPLTKLALKVLGGITALVVLITLIITLVKGSDDSVMYLVAVNMLISSVVGSIIAWWYHNGTIEAKKVAFMAFVAICITFQAIISDIYVYNKKKVVAPSPIPQPTEAPTNWSTVATPTH